MEQTVEHPTGNAASLQENFQHYVADTEDYVRQNPAKASLVAIGLGFLLAQLPIRWMLVALIKVMFLLIKPATFVYAISKLIDDIRGSESE